MNHINQLNKLLPAETNSPEETQTIGVSIAQKLQSGNIVALYGDLGAGKTHITKGICQGLDIDSEFVNSPTFTLVNEYAGGKIPVYHFDAYRIKSIDEFYEMGFEDYFYDDAICIIEWPSRIEKLLPDDTIRLKLTHISEKKREISLI